MIHQSGFSWNTRGITIYSFSDVTTIIHQKKYQLYLFIFAQHFTVIYIFIQNPPQPTSIYIFPLASYWTKHKHPFIQTTPIYFIYHPHHPTSQGAGMAKAVLPELKTMPSTSNTRSSSAENHSELAQGGRVGDVPGVRSVVGKNVVGKHMLDSDLVRIRWFRWFKNWFWYDFLETHLFLIFFILSTLLGDFLEAKSDHRFLQLQFDRLLNFAIRSSTTRSFAKH